MSPVVVIYDVSSMCMTGDICGIGYRGYIVSVILKTQYPIILVSGVRNVKRKPQESCSEAVVLIYVNVFDLLFTKMKITKLCTDVL